MRSPEWAKTGRGWLGSLGGQGKKIGGLRGLAVTFWGGGGTLLLTGHSTQCAQLSLKFPLGEPACNFLPAVELMSQFEFGAGPKVAEWNAEMVMSTPDIQPYLADLKAELPNSPALEQLEAWLAQWAWLQAFHHCSQLLVAAIHPADFSVRYANQAFCDVLAIAAGRPQATPLTTTLTQALNQLLTPADQLAVKRLYRRHLLHLVLREFYQVDPQHGRLLEAPAIVQVQGDGAIGVRYVQFWLRSQHLQVTRRPDKPDELADLGLGALSPAELDRWLTEPDQVQQLEERLCLAHYTVHGVLLLEGLDVTVQETIRQTTQLLIDRDSILQAQKFQQVDQQLRLLFQAERTLILTVEADQIRLFTGTMPEDMDITTYSLELLQESYITRAIATNQVQIIRDLSTHYQTELGRQLVASGVRSVLLIPLVAPVASHATHHPYPALEKPQVVGLVGIVSDRPNQFDGLDCCYAEQLIPAFTRALTLAQQQLMQKRFVTNIHPAVEWRFLQEAERRSLGLPPEPVVFNNVYPLYGISDIRGSSDARNRAIQADVLAQYALAVAVVEAVYAADQSAFTQQLRLDLLDRMRSLEASVTVDAEITELRYLRDQFEAYFEYFAKWGEAAIAAIQTYRDACNNSQNGVYKARAEYDKIVNQINSLLRSTWDQWQLQMQKITPHYCDIEATDGIDHMIYAGSSIDPNFTPFQLRSLRYEQLRALCDCARTTLQFQQTNQTSLQVAHLVLVQDSTVDIFHDETTERLFDVRGTRDTRYEIVKKRIDKGLDQITQARITQPGMITLVFSTPQEQEEYQQYLRYLIREGWIHSEIEQGNVEPLQGVTGLKFMRVAVLPAPTEPSA